MRFNIPLLVVDNLISYLLYLLSLPLFNPCRISTLLQQRHRLHLLDQLAFIAADKAASVINILGSYLLLPSTAYTPIPDLTGIVPSFPFQIISVSWTISYWQYTSANTLSWSRCLHHTYTPLFVLHRVLNLWCIKSGPHTQKPPN